MKNENYDMAYNYALALDLINVLSFILGIENLESNNKQINSLEKHLSKQDAQYDKIISLLEELKLQKGGSYERRNETK